MPSRNWQQQAVLLPCYFGAYDTNNDGVINLDEFMDASLGYTKRSPKDIFDRFDINSKIKPYLCDFIYLLKHLVHANFR